MILTVLAVLLFLLPFILIYRFQDKVLGFVYILTLSLGLHLSLGLITQATHIFTYPLIITIHAIFVTIALFFVFRQGFQFKKIKIKSGINWLAIGAFLLIFFELWSIHFSYTGIVDTHRGIEIREENYYPYPLYSDEWVGVSLADYVIAEKSLPMVNPLNANSPFINFLSGFHSMMSELFLFFELAPLTSYVYFAISNTLLLCLLLFLILRSLGISNVVSLVPVLIVPLMTNSGNLPGAWYILPFTLALNFLLLAIMGFIKKDKIIGGVALAISLLIYPPMIIFALPIMIYEYRYRGLIYICGIALLVMIVGLFSFAPKELIVQAWQFLIRENLDNGIVSYGIWNIIPIYIIPFFIVGLYKLFKAKNYLLLGPTVIGILYWIMYSFIMPVIIIEAPRVVVITSFFLLVAAGVGIQSIWKYFKKYLKDNKVFIIRLIKVATFSFFCIMAIFFPGREKWNNLLIHVETAEGVKSFSPTPPVNNYLQEDEKLMFQQFKGKWFIAPPWKGLVLGVATHNYPLHSKSSTVTNSILTYGVFSEANCAEKSKLAQSYKIDLAYGHKFNCSNFKEIGRSGEGLYLYSYAQP